MISICFMIVVCLLSTSYTQGTYEKQSPIEIIGELRDAQKTSSYNEFYRYESEVQRIKQRHGNSQGLRISRVRHMFISLFHFLPLILWQFFALVLALLVVILPRRSLSAFMILLVICILISLGYREHSKEWLIIAKKQALHLGPGLQYPVRAELSYLDEVSVKKQLAQWTKIVRNGAVGWIHND